MAEDTGLGLEMKDGKLTGALSWGCEGDQCKSVIQHFNDLSAQNDFLEISHTLAADASSADARIRFFSNEQVARMQRDGIREDDSS